ncbi:4410_t:CDS:2 [Ambispora gerdemannii]|uniref:4410_t:CDS:1 n=1 Tax=Ambispora gerdemannii TaxID=144530 RepID=A0A9N9CEW5_9GLOM|nr:4410_t:CDS:2 [Ambispora gerdemannii]
MTNDNDDASSITNTSAGRIRLLGTFAGIGSNCNNMIGAGIFSCPGLVLSEIQSPGIALILWAVGGIAALFGSLSYLGSSIPEGGGETVYLKRAFPHPPALLSYMFSFSTIVAIRPASMCAIANVFAQYFLYTIKATERCDIDYLHPTQYITDWKFWQLRLCSLTAVFIVTIYHILSNKWANRINQTLTIIKMLVLLIISIIGIATIPRFINDENTNWKNMFPSVNISARSLTAALIPILFAYNGWNNLNYTLDEFVNPKEKLFMSNSISVDLCANIAYTNVPLAKLTGKSEPSEIIAGRFAFQVGGFNLARALSFFICLSAFGALAANTWAGSRVIVASAKNNYIPFSQWLRKWNKTTHTPIFALITQAVWCSLIIIIYPQNDPFKFFINLGQHCMWVFLFLSALGLLFLRHYNPDLERPFRVFLLIPIIFIVFALFIIIGSFVNDASKIHATAQEQQLKQHNGDKLCESDKDYKYATFDYYLPFVVSLVVIGVGATCWYVLYSLGCQLRFKTRRVSCLHIDDASSCMSWDDDEELQVKIKRMSLRQMSRDS